MKKLEIYRKEVWGPFKKYISSKLSIFLTSLPQADPDPFFKPVYQLGRQNSNGKLKWNFYILITKNKKGYFFLNFILIYLLGLIVFNCINKKNTRSK